MADFGGQIYDSEQGDFIYNPEVVASFTNSALATAASLGINRNAYSITISPVL
jgi:hypothetical protein